MAADVNSSFGLSQNRVIINVPVGRLLCSRKWMNSDLVASVKGHILRWINILLIIVGTKGFKIAISR